MQKAGENMILLYLIKVRPFRAVTRGGDSDPKWSDNREGGGGGPKICITEYVTLIGMCSIYSPYEICKKLVKFAG